MGKYEGNDSDDNGVGWWLECMMIREWEMGG